MCIGVFFCYNVRMHKRKFKKSGQDNLRISSLLCQSGTHVVKATLRILLAAAPRSARFSRSSFLNMYSKRKFKKPGQESCRISSLLCQSGTHVVKATLRILLAAAPRPARFSRSSFLNMYSKRKFKKPGQDNLRISSLLCQSGTHVVKATLRILLAAAPRPARFSRSSFLNMYSKRKFKKPGQDNCFFEKTYKDD